MAVSSVDPEKVFAAEWVFDGHLVQPIYLFEVYNAVSRIFHLGPTRPTHIARVVGVLDDRLGGKREERTGTYTDCQ